MQEIIVKKDLVDAGFTIIAERYQSIYQYNNIGAQLLHKNNAVICVEDGGADTTEYLLDKIEREAALKNPDLFLTHCIGEWIDNEEDQTLSFYQWYPEEIKESCNDGEPCRVLIVGCYFGHEPIDWAKNNDGEDIVFSSPGKAQEWIDEQESSPYMLKHGEAGRPDYFIIS